jgi:hypothetical protein
MSSLLSFLGEVKSYRALDSWPEARFDSGCLCGDSHSIIESELHDCQEQ